jgi:RluA family pseudouridine synthase
MALTTLFRSTEMLVIDKPAGLSVHNAGPGEKDVLEIVRQALSLKSVFPVHRLDKETSGVQILALNENAAKVWHKKFQSRQLSKTYRAIVRGSVDSKAGVWNWSLTDRSEGRTNPRGLSQNRVPCETRFHVLLHNPYFSLLELDLCTGRQHQIRKHAAIDKHAIVGDSRYGERKYNDRISNLYGTQRLFLHCHRISCNDFLAEAPLPAEFHRFMEGHKVESKVSD